MLNNHLVIHVYRRGLLSQDQNLYTLNHTPEPHTIEMLCFDEPVNVYSVLMLINQCTYMNSYVLNVNVDVLMQDCLEILQSCTKLSKHIPVYSSWENISMTRFHHDLDSKDFRIDFDQTN